MENSESSTAIERALDLAFSLSAPEEDAPELSLFTMVSLSDLAELGQSFADLASSLSSPIESKVTISGKDLFRATIPNGAHLANAKGGGYRGSAVVDGKGVVGQAVFQDAGDLTATISTKVPVDPTTFALGLAVASINERLGQIEETQQEMFDYIKNKDQAELESGFRSLKELMDEYRHNWDNPSFKEAKLILVQDIKQDASKQIVQHRLEATNRLKKRQLVRVDQNVQEQLEGTLEEILRYRSSVFLYSFSSLFEVLLHENYDERYLETVADHVEQHYIDYLKTYTSCYNRFEHMAGTTVQSIMLQGLSAAGKTAGRAIAKMPFGDRLPVDGGLEKVGDLLGYANQDKNDKLLGMLLSAKDCDVKPFTESIRNVSLLLNKPIELISDGESLYYRQLEQPRQAHEDV